MPQLLFAGLLIAGVWLAAKAVRALTQAKPAKDAVDAAGRERVRRLRQDPKTGVYRPED